MLLKKAIFTLFITGILLLSCGPLVYAKNGSAGMLVLADASPRVLSPHVEPVNFSHVMIVENDVDRSVSAPSADGDMIITGSQSFNE